MKETDAMNSNEYELFKRIDENEITTVDDLCLLEDLSIQLKQLNDKIDFYKEYKKKKSATITEAINKVSGRVDKIKTIILESLKVHGQKSINFPGSCQIKTVSPRKTWAIKDQDEMIKFLKEKEAFDDVLTSIEYKFDKKLLDKFFNLIQSQGELTEERKEWFDLVAKDSYISVSYENKDIEDAQDINTSEEEIKVDSL